jgi:glycyl-tRNA synthetase beta chain
MNRKDFLVEIGTEELPPKALFMLSRAFAKELETGLRAEALVFDSLRTFATPRRLAVIVNQLSESQADKTIERFGPAVSAAYDSQGNAAAAALGFAKSCQVDITKLSSQVKDGVEKLVYRSVQKGGLSSSLLPGIISNALAKLPIPKRMRWGSSRVEFVRPVHWVILLFGNETLKCEILGVESANKTRGHRFHHDKEIAITSPSQYQASLLDPGKVIADFSERRERIRQSVLEQAVRLKATAVIEDELLDEVTSLVEWPVALTGKIDKYFLELPKEALITSMKTHQKCFYLLDNKGELLPHFITVSNLESKDPAQVIAGNEKVIRPRLADAAFFFATDKKQSLFARRAGLEKVVFQKELGTVLEKSDRVSRLASYIATALDADVDSCKRAADLSKCDLLTSMVGEFAELQGIMAYYYALHDGETQEVATALNEQYMPRFAGDSLPQTPTGCILAIADKLDTITGLFVIGQPPTGSKDPFALRRAIGVLRILVEKNLDLDIYETIVHAMDGFRSLPKNASSADGVFDFLLERFRAWYQEQGISSEVFQSVMVLKPQKPTDFNARINAVHHFAKLPEARALSSANKRVSNILGKLDDSLNKLSVNNALLALEAEKQLAAVVTAKAVETAPLFKQRKYKEGLTILADSKATVDRFFDEVLVMDDDPAIRNNRIALLQLLRNLFLQVADISFLHQS